MAGIPCHWCWCGNLDDVNREVVDTALEQVSNGEVNAAIATLRGRFESVYERRRPVLLSEQHPAACHLYEHPPRTSRMELFPTLAKGGGFDLMSDQGRRLLRVVLGPEKEQDERDPEDHCDPDWC